MLCVWGGGRGGLGGIDGLPSLVNQPDMKDSHERLGHSSDRTSQNAAVTSLEGPEDSGSSPGDFSSNPCGILTAAHRDQHIVQSWSSSEVTEAF